MRKAKKKQAQAQNELITILMIGISVVIYYYTKSITIAVASFIVLLGIGLGFMIYRNYLYQERLKKSGIHDIDKMDGLQFESYLVALFKGLGYKAKKTPATNDFGADLILEGNDRVVVQAKCYKNKVGIKAVQEVVSAKGYYKAEQAWVVTNSFFTSQAEKLAESTNVRLIDRNSLQDMILKINPSITPKDIRQAVPPEPVKCSVCGSPMVVKQGKYGDFFACSRYPVCKNTRAIAK